MNVALILNMDRGMMKVMEKIRESAFSMGVSISEIYPVTRAIDIPMAVRKLGERADVDSMMIIADFPEIKMEHEKPLFERIRSEVESISMEVKKEVSMDLFSMEPEKISDETIEGALKGLLRNDGENTRKNLNDGAGAGI